VLCLTGEVDSIAAKRQALRLAHALAGDYGIEDRLRLRTREQRANDALRLLVVSTLATEPTFRDFAIRSRDDAPPPTEGSWINIDVEGSTIILSGEVWSLSHRRLAEVMAWWVPGTADVDNRLQVRPPEQDSDDELADAVRLVLEKDPTLDVQQISIAARDREVTLNGVVRSEEYRRIAAEDCWFIPGVHAVHNRLEVRPGVVTR
jgi:osmotically-inducible protein OsmY